ncbi:response regulator transcription factor [Mucilaginibacter sp. 21P]|uniref:LytR/AlgR family response regulator transcription factor n=1 Tax=Mucilaginibacter sp. 21P TaxID=2778902 RepID=UPI001C590635|nr:LytTR family DNA-binding domain-containing protein [Mucilaginibacter sp. 21P]QXV66860.1 response regulator transcription factor [Mucilaginibacter sp. 21P]
MAKKISCIIVDDEEGAHLVIKHYLQNLKHIEVTDSFYNALEALEHLHIYPVDLMFLDINMPGLSGLQMLRSLSNPPMVILTTAYREHALESYEYRVVDYLVKPFEFQRFIQAIDNAYSRMQTSASVISVDDSNVPSSSVLLKVDSGLIRVESKEVIYIQSWGNYIKVYTDKQTFLSPVTTTEIVQKLDPLIFQRVHKSFIVSLSKIKKLSGGQLEMAGGTAIPIGNTYRRELMEKLK